MKSILRFNAAILMLVLLGGCAGTWTRVETPAARDPGNAFVVQLPVGWVRAGQFGDRIIVTRDGVDLQVIELVRLAHKKAFAAIKKESRPNMLPSELAELAIANIKKAGGFAGNLEVLDNRPATVAGKSGFRLRLRFRNANGLRLEREVYGFVDEKGFYRMTYQAPVIYYYDKDLLTFEKIVHSMRLVGG